MFFKNNKLAEHQQIKETEIAALINELDGTNAKILYLEKKVKSADSEHTMNELIKALVNSLTDLSGLQGGLSNNLNELKDIHKRSETNNHSADDALVDVNVLMHSA